MVAQAVNPTITDRTYSGFQYGYSTSNNNRAESTKTTITAGKSSSVGSGNYTLKLEVGNTQIA